MLVLVGIINNGFALDRFLGHGEVEHDLARLGRGGGHHAEFERVQCFAGIPLAGIGQEPQRVIADLDWILAQAALRIGQRAAQQADDLLGREGFELEDLRAGNQRGIDVEGRVMGCRADQAHRALLDIRQQHILLGLVKPVQLINEQDRPAAGLGEAVRRRRGNPSQIGDGRPDTAETLEMAAGGAGDDFCQRGLTGPRRTVQQDGTDPVRLDRAPQKLTGFQQMRLADKFVQ